MNACPAIIWMRHKVLVPSRISLAQTEFRAFATFFHRKSLECCLSGSRTTNPSMLAPHRDSPKSSPLASGSWISGSVSCDRRKKVLIDGIRPMKL